MEDKKYYVYVHKDEQDNIVYVGHGCGERYKSLSGRSDKHRSMFKDLTKEIIHNNLTKNEAIKIEDEILVKMDGSKTLLNVTKRSRVTKEVKYEEMSKVFYLDSTSPSYLRWKINVYSGENYKAAKIKAGDSVGTLAHGYWDTHFNHVFYKVHRIVWCLANKQDTPTNMLVDHVNRNRADNSPDNLRLVNNQINSLNTRIRSTNTSGVKGVCPRTFQSGKFSWVAQWRLNGKNVVKYFTPHVLFPELPFDEAKEKCLALAKEYRQKSIEENYGENFHE